MNTKKITLRQLYMFLLGLTSTLYIVRVFGIPLFYFLALIGIFVFRKFSIKIDRAYGAYIVVILISLAVNIDNGYVYTMVLSAALSSIICLFYMGLLRQNVKIIEYLLAGIKASCALQLIWCLLQYVSYHAFRLDINQVVFSQMFHMIDNASRYVNGNLVLTGFCWHPSNMVPVLVLSIVMFNTWYIWLICIFIAVGMNSSTAILALLTLGIIKILRLLIRKEIFKHLTMTKIVGAGLAIVFVVVAITTTNLGIQIAGGITRLVERINGTNVTLSTTVHRSYYTLLPLVIRNTSIGKILFGYGPGCSGLAITRINGQYSLLGSWVVESDYMNILYGYGIIGFIIYFFWIIRTIMKKSPQKIFFIEFLMPLLVAGITYNVKYYWVVFTILVMSVHYNKEVQVRAGK